MAPDNEGLDALTRFLVRSSFTCLLISLEIFPFEVYLAKHLRHLLPMGLFTFYVIIFWLF